MQVVERFAASHEWSTAVGHCGTSARRKYTVLGKQATWLLVNKHVSAESLGDRAFRGITRPVEVFQVCGPSVGP